MFNCFWYLFVVETELTTNQNIIRGKMIIQKSYIIVYV